jgi:hypothetical protein
MAVRNLDERCYMVLSLLLAPLPTSNGTTPGTTPGMAGGAVVVYVKPFELKIKGRCKCHVTYDHVRYYCHVVLS